LYRNKWSKYDGLGAIILSPVRELAIQIFEVLNSFAFIHKFSVGLIIGGKNYKVERNFIE
jgi:ATP-dependent RNA helicase DDX10/DBP4